MTLFLLCCGTAGWFGYVQPHIEAGTRHDVYDALGVPDGFARGDTEADWSQGWFHASYYLDCPKSRCPVDPAEKTHDWLTDGGMANLTVQDVADCFRDEQNYIACDRLSWRRDGCEVEVSPSFTVGEHAEDRRVLLSLHIGECN